MTQSTVAVALCDAYEEEKVKAAFDEIMKLTNGLDFVKEGMTVAIKVNLVTAIKPDKAATTHPMLVKELCRRITEKGAKAVIGDSPGGPFSAAYLKGVYAATGMSDCICEGVSTNSDYSISSCEHFEEAKVMKSFEYTSWLKNADAIINFSKLKTHGMMSLSAAVKNLFGAIPGTVKPEYHFRFPNAKDFAEMLIDIDEFFKCDLNIVDGVIGMEGNGPTMGKPKKIGIIAAGKSPYDLDLVCAGIIGLTPDKVPTVELAIERGLGNTIDNINVAGSGKDFKMAEFENIEKQNSIEFFGELVGIRGKLFSGIAKAALCSKPKLKPSECIGCQKCANICPAKAIEMKNNKPVIDRKKCIRCFCCQEFCPKGAMKVHRPVIARILKKI